MGRTDAGKMRKQKNWEEQTMGSKIREGEIREKQKKETKGRKEDIGKS